MGTVFDTALFGRFKLGYKVSANDFQKYGMLALLPWSLKPVIGLVSDRFPICGHKKRFYVILFGACGIAASSAMAFYNTTLSIHATIFCVFLTSFQLAGTDLLTESEYAKVMALNPTSSASIVSIVWMFVFAGQIIGGTISGVGIKLNNGDILFWLLIPCCVQLVLPAVMGWYDDSTCTPSRCDQGLAVVAMCIATSAITLSIVSIYTTWQVRLCICIIIALVMLALTRKYLAPTIAASNMYMFTASILNVEIPGTLNYWYTADETCVPGGPGFTMEFFVLTSGIVGAVSGAAAVLLFRYTSMQHWEFRTLFCTTTFLRCATALIDIAIVNRWNIHIGVPDRIFFILGKACVQSAVTMLEQTPAVILTSKLCTAGNESTIYAILAGFQNLGMAISLVVGTVLADSFGVHLTPGVCTYSNLPYLISVANILLPMLSAPLSYWLVPPGTSSSESSLIQNIR